jgi:hypothetical protein
VAHRRAGQHLEREHVVGAQLFTAQKVQRFSHAGGVVGRQAEDHVE